MSDPMTNTEVEDVLASIRRLVSDDTRAVPEAETIAPSDRLVLTPALRVTEEPSAADTLAEENEAEEPVAETEEDSDLADDPFGEDVDHSAEVEEPAVTTEEISDSGSEHHASSWEVSLDAERDAEDDEDAHVSEQNDETGEWPADPEGESQHDTSGSDTFDAESEEYPIALDTVDLEQDTLMSIQDAFADVESDAAEAEPDVAEPVEQSVRLSAKIAALETLIAGQADEFEPETAGDGENAGTEPPTLEWEDAEEEGPVTAETTAEEDTSAVFEDPVVGGVTEDAEPEDTQIFSSDEDVLDEDALRDLVSDIVREELQGALGERITRNVRKLVRREIHRALAAQELE